MNMMNLGDYIGIGSIVFLLVSPFLLYLSKKPVHAITDQEDFKEDLPLAEKIIEEKSDQVEAVQKIETPKVTWGDRLWRGLSRGRKEFWGKLENIIQSKDGLSEDLIEEIEELLYTADLGHELVDNVLEELKEAIKNETKTSEGKLSEVIRTILFKKLKEKMVDVQSKQETIIESLWKSGSNEETQVIMIVGINGAGKTTTIGKLAKKFSEKNNEVLVGACDTFRAAAVEQLKVWCERANVPVVSAKEGANPSGVTYDTVNKAFNEKYDICLIDTAGRLHNHSNLMEELTKNKRVIQKLDENAPQHRWLVLDAITGQNALRQAEEFHKALDLTGIILTKCDGSAKAGNAMNIVSKLQVPILFIGVGETAEDLDLFNLDQYLYAMLGKK